MWQDIQWNGDDNWIAEAIQDGTCIVVTDGSYMKTLYPDIHSAAFVFECKRVRGRLWGLFPEVSRNSCSYRGELMGLLVVHLILQFVNEVNEGLSRKVTIYSDCLGARDKVEHLPSSRIPTGCAHSDLLKTILVNCKDLSFNCFYSHVSDHQDNHKDYTSLTQPSQLKCSMDYLAKRVFWNLQGAQPPTQQAFPLEPICVFAGPTKITADMRHYIRIWAHCHLACNKFHSMKILSNQEFDRVDWEMVYETLNNAPQLFQVWACKQGMGIACPVEWDKSVVRKCPSCMIARDTCEHVLHCRSEGRVETLRHTLDLTKEWLEDKETNPELLDCIMEFAHGGGRKTMGKICEGLDQ
jgi:hypothetical protein